MDNVYVLATYLAAIIGLVGCGLMKLSDILEQRRDRKYYEMIRQDAEFWQMKVEQTGVNLTDMLMDKAVDKMKTEMQDALKVESDKPKEVEQKDAKMKEDLFEGLDEWLPF